MTTPLLNSVTTLGSLRILRAMAELTKTEAREQLAPQAATDALDDAIDALAAGIKTLERMPRLMSVDLLDGQGPRDVTVPHPDPIVELRLEGARRRTAPSPAIATCACDLWPLTDLEATVDDGVLTHSYVACINGGTVIAQRAQLESVTGLTGEQA